jgi:hypothetical protein
VKKFIAQSLKKITKGSFDNTGAVVFGVILGSIVVAAFLAAPLLLVWGLQLMGLPVTITFSSWFGALLIMLVLRSGSGSSKSE